MADLLRLWGHEVETDWNGQEGLEKVTSFNPALVVSDLRLPSLSGLKLVKRVRQAELPTTFTMLTGQGDH